MQPSEPPPALPKSPASKRPRTTKVLWTPQEDELLRTCVALYNVNNWHRVAQHLPHRTNKQCRDRWHNHLSPEVSKLPWSAEEDYILFQNYQRIGAKWAEIAKLLPGRTDNAVKNRFHSTLRRIQRRQGPGDEKDVDELATDTNLAAAAAAAAMAAAMSQGPPGVMTLPPSLMDPVLSIPSAAHVMSTGSGVMAPSISFSGAGTAVTGTGTATDTSHVPYGAPGIAFAPRVLSGMSMPPMYASMMSAGMPSGQLLAASGMPQTPSSVVTGSVMSGAPRQGQQGGSQGGQSSQAGGSSSSIPMPAPGGSDQMGMGGQNGSGQAGSNNGGGQGGSSMGGQGAGGMGGQQAGMMPGMTMGPGGYRMAPMNFWVAPPPPGPRGYPMYPQGYGTPTASSLFMPSNDIPVEGTVKRQRVDGSSDQQQSVWTSDKLMQSQWNRSMAYMFGPSGAAPSSMPMGFGGMTMSMSGVPSMTQQLASVTGMHLPSMAQSPPAQSSPQMTPASMMPASMQGGRPMSAHNGSSNGTPGSSGMMMSSQGMSSSSAQASGLPEHLLAQLVGSQPSSP